ncbi:MAG: hypothetical protein ING69_10445 [Rhodocyclaceae bacterium]|nr:hypothetical protein [Rhodocyclaceae bacterium]MCA3083059.1 hypothetical protein [Rhodocyclaceae bacterium]
MLFEELNPTFAYSSEVFSDERVQQMLAETFNFEIDSDSPISASSSVTLRTQRFAEVSKTEPAAKISFADLTGLFAIKVVETENGARNIEIELDENEYIELLQYARYLRWWSVRSPAFFPPFFENLTFEYRGYFGINSLCFDHVVNFFRRGGKWVATATAYGAGTIIGKVAFSAGSIGSEDVIGPKVAIKLREWGESATAPIIGRSLSEPDLDVSQQIAHSNKAIVLVHGTLSSAGLAFHALQDVLKSSLPGGAPILTYDHNTFDSIGKNSQELVDLVKSRLGGKKLLFLSHSRGGLVALGASGQLCAHGFFVEVCNVGTPHLGTPMVLAGRGMIRTLTKWGNLAGAAGGAFVPLAAPYAMGKLLAHVAQLPIGILEMKPGSSATTYASWQTAAWPPSTVIGNVFNSMAAAASPGHHFLSGVADQCIEGEHDTVVPISSAVLNLAATSYVCRDDHTHFEMFHPKTDSGNRVRDCLNQF